MARAIYTVILYVLLPFVFIRLLWRSRRLPAYRRRWQERLGFSQLRLADSIWLHAVSVGETRAAIPLVNALLTRYPQYSIVVTTTTPTGAEQVSATWAGKVTHVYLPYDLPFAVNRFLENTSPRIAIIMETELWPNLFSSCQKRGISIVVANARLSERSAKGYQRIRSLTQETLKNITIIAAQAVADAERFNKLGADPNQVSVMGNLKFDIAFAADLSLQSQALRAQWGRTRPVWIAASTHAKEEEQVLAAYTRIHQRLPNTLLVLAPRHPDRFREVENLCRGSGFALIKRSQQLQCTDDVQIYLADSMGELPLLYGASDIAFVGGSLVPTGGHNILEAIVQGIPVVFGPHMFNFSVISQQMLSVGAAKCINDEQELSQIVITWLFDADARKKASEAGKKLVGENQGALERLLKIIESLIASPKA